MAPRMLQLLAPHFTAGVEVRDGRVVLAAPILSYMKGWDEDRVRSYCLKKGWVIRSAKVTASPTFPAGTASP